MKTVALTAKQFGLAMMILFGQNYTMAARVLCLRRNKIVRMCAGHERIYSETSGEILNLLRRKRDDAAALLAEIEGAS